MLVVKLTSYCLKTDIFLYNAIKVKHLAEVHIFGIEYFGDCVGFTFCVLSCKCIVLVFYTLSIPGFNENNS